VAVLIPDLDQREYVLHGHDYLFSKPLDDDILDGTAAARVTRVVAITIAVGVGAVCIVTADLINLDFCLGTRSQEVIDPLIVDLQVREPQQELHIRVASYVVENVLNAQLDDPWVRLRALKVATIAQISLDGDGVQ
jgi:hypothetical protein